MPGITFLTLSFAAIIVFGTAAACLYDSLEARLPALRATPYGGSGGRRRSPAVAPRHSAAFVPAASTGPRRSVRTGRDRRCGTRVWRGPERRGFERRGSTMRA